MDTGALTRWFAAPLPPLTRGERIGVLALSLLVALSRWPAVAKSLWDWDEALFVLAVRDGYDVAAYHPHPPGFPLFVAAAKLLPLDPFHALQAIVVLSALFVFPAGFFLGRELRANVFISVGTGLILAFLPNVWFYGGTAFSDVPSMVLSVVASALLLRGCRSSRALIAGSVVLGIAAGIRPQNLIVCAIPIVIALLCRRRVALVGLLIVAVIVCASYGGAALATGDAYAAAIAEHGRYIRNTDSFLSATRPSLLRVADDFFLRPFRAPVINILGVVLAVIALIRRRPHTLAALAIFGPFVVFAWLFLDFHSTSRFSIAYMPLFAILPADAIETVPSRFRLSSLAALLAVMIAWTFPVLRVVHTNDSPPVAAMKFVRANAHPSTTFLDVDPRLGPHAEVYLRDYERGTRKAGTAVMFVREGTGLDLFTWPRERLAGIARPRYFEVGVDR